MDADDSFISQDSACAHTPKTAGDDLANSLLSFTTTPGELELQSVKRQKISRDPMSHRIIEKRRRDRMNNCLADLSRLIPTSYLKQGQGRIEKTEIIEMAIKHIRSLQAQVDGNQPQSFSATETTQDARPSSETCRTAHGTCCHEQFQHGFKECQNETLRYFVEGEAMVASDPFCMRVMEHLSTIAQQCGTHTLTDDKHGIQMDLEAQQMTGSSTSFSSSTSSRNSILPLLPTPDGMVVPASPDKHLQNLLTTCALRQLEAERETAVPQSVNKVISCSTSEVASLSSPPLETIATTWVSSPQPASSVSCDLAMPVVVKNCDNLNECVSSGYMSDTSAMDRLSSGSSFSTGPGESMLTTKDNNVANVYKFKHNITKRFSLEGKIISQQCDGSSSTSSRETDEEHHHHSSIKYRSFKNKCRHASSSDSGPYPVSEVSGSTSASSHDGVKGNFDRNKNRKVGSRSVGTADQAAVGTDCPRTSMPLPGFVLHPSGTHYMPMSVCYNSIPEVFDTGMEIGLGPPVFHPISIPVHFRGPVISVPGSSLCSAGTTSQHKDTKEAKTGQGS